MHPLNLPEFEFKTRQIKGVNEIFDEIRMRFVKLTPEEWVRQNLIQFLIKHKNFPQGRIGIEKKLILNTMTKRTDAVVYNANAIAQLIIECKSPEVLITQKTFDQISRYNMVLKVEYLLVSNGLSHYFCKFDQKNNKYAFVPEIPFYSEL